MTNSTVDIVRGIKSQPTVENINFRQYRDPDDLTALASVMQNALKADRIDRAVTEDDVSLTLMHLENFNIERDMLVAEVDGILAGYVWVNWRELYKGQRSFRHSSSLAPEWRRKKIGSVFLHFAEARALAISRRDPADQEQFLEVDCHEKETGKIALVEANGYQPARYFIDMIRDLEHEYPLAPMPVGLRLRPAEPEQYRKIMEAANEAFREHWGHRETTEADFQWWINNRNFQPELWKVAWDGDEVAGMVLNYIDLEENERFNRKRGYTEDISVRGPWRRKGLARALLVQSMQDLKQHGMTEAALMVDIENPLGALKLYRNVGFKEQQRSIAYRKALSDPRDPNAKIG